jgi:hypothetical protein
MKKIILLLFLIPVFAFSQKVKLKDNVVYLDDTAWLHYQDCGAFDQTCSLLDTNNEELIFMNWVSVPGQEPISKSNTDGSLDYVEIKFIGYNKIIEVQKRQKDIIILLYNSKVINEDFTINEEKIDRLIEKYGTPFSERLNQNTNTIIIKQEKEAEEKSGINIKIGG